VSFLPANNNASGSQTEGELKKFEEMRKEKLHFKI